MDDQEHQLSELATPTLMRSARGTCEHASLDQIDAMRSVLLKLAEIKTASVATGKGRKRPARQLLGSARSSSCATCVPPWPTTRRSASTPSRTRTETTTDSPTANGPVGSRP